MIFYDFSMTKKGKSTMYPHSIFFFQINYIGLMNAYQN